MGKDYDYKLVICGNSGVGKTYIERHFFQGMSFEVNLAYLMENLQLDVARAEMVTPDGGDIIKKPLTKEEKEEALKIAKGR